MPFLRRPASDQRKSGADSRPLQSLGSYVAPPASETTETVLDKPVSSEEVRRLFRTFLQASMGDTVFAREKARSGVTVIDLIEELLHSPEFEAHYFTAKIMSGGEFRTPSALAQPVLKPQRVLLIGSCASDVFYEQMLLREHRTQFEKITFNNGSVLPPLSAEAAAEIDFQVVQLPIRAIMPEHMYMGGDIPEAQARSWFDVSKSLLQMNLEAALAYNRDHDLQTFVLNFTTPQQNPLGRLQNPYIFSNPVFYISELNRELYRLVEPLQGAYTIDTDQISSSLGKRFIQDDSVSHLNHGSTLTNMDTTEDKGRIEPIGDVSRLYSQRVADFNWAIYDEILAAYRSIRQHRAIKLVIFDLDDTLWRGVAAERLDSLDVSMTEGWPLGILEAASFVMKRGVIVSIVSKNDEENVVRIWNELYENRFPLESFVGRKINWEPKVENVKRILELVNVGADATLFVDDNPAERSRVREGVPGIRVLEGPVAEWRRQLLWSAELQPPVITDESLGRAASIRAKVERDDNTRQLTREAFLDQLDLNVAFVVISDRKASQFVRCLELINKTNQFNTTGRRWTEAELERLFESGGWLLAVTVRDRYATYGVTGVAICEGATIVQYVMSCRVFGLGVEDTALVLCCNELRRRGATAIDGRIVSTERNHLSADLFERFGFQALGEGLWRLQADKTLAIPSHVTLAEATA